MPKDISAKHQLQALYDDYSAKLPATLAHIEQTWQSLQQDWETDTLSQLYRRVHSLVGNAASFGFTNLSVTARPLEAQLQRLQLSGSRPNDKQREEIRALIHAVTSAVEPGAPSPEAKLIANPVRITQHKRIYLVDDDKDLSNYLAIQLSQQGYQIEIFNKLDGLLHSLKENPADLLIMDVMLTEGSLAGPALLLNLRKRQVTGCPVIFISARTDMQARLAAVRANGDAYFQKPLQLDSLCEKIEELLDLQRDQAYNVLIVDEGSRFVAPYLKALRQARMHVQVLKEPMQIMLALEKYHPSVALINTQLQRLSAVELATVIRQRQDSAHIPLIFYAQPFNQTLRQIAMRGIADDFLGENVSPAKLVTTIINRVQNNRLRSVQIRETSSKDPLTGLYNRHYLMAHLELATKYNDMLHRLAVIYLSLDNYHSVDKIMGMVASDALLSDTARLLNKQIRKPDVLARFGDNTFVILSFSRSVERLKSWGEELCHCLQQQVVEVAGQQLSSTCSIGIGLYYRPNSGPEQALLDANLACDEAQENGGNAVRLHSSLHNLELDRERRLHWQRSIKTALARDKFNLVYQPIVSLHGEVKQFYDVLLRMNNLANKEEHIVPSEFLPVAEQLGLMPSIDRWVVKQILRSLSAHYAEGQALHLFVRLSGQTLEENSLGEWLEHALCSARFPHEALVFDLALNDVSSHLKQAEQFAQHIKRLGARLCLRDFDDGSEAMQLTRLLNADFVKLKSRYVQGLTDNANSLKAIQAITEEIHRERRVVIAPFVEDAGSLSLLWQHQIDYIAGQFVQAPTDSLDYDFG